MKVRYAIYLSDYFIYVYGHVAHPDGWAVENGQIKKGSEHRKNGCGRSINGVLAL